MKRILTIGIFCILTISWIKIGDSKSVQENRNNEKIKTDSEIVKSNIEEKIENLGEKINYLYTKSSSVNVRDNFENGKIIDTLLINTRVEVKEEFILDKENQEEKSNEKTLVLVKYKKDDIEKEGWIDKITLSNNPLNRLPETWSELDFSPNPKREYPNNPRVEVKGIHLSGNSVSIEKSLSRLINLANKTEINAFVIDVKDDEGYLLWDMPDIVEKHGIKMRGKGKVKDIESLVARLKENGIYLIARIVSFKDPIYASSKLDRAIIDKKTGNPFTNSDGIIWVSPHDRELWEYNLDISKEAARVGFNEIQFDYVRFPASNGGKLDAALDYRNINGESKPVAIQKYLKLAYKELSTLGVYVSADVYGQVATDPGDMGLGQYWEAVSNYVDYISPMVYPSHYRNGVYGTKNADAEPYKIVKYSTRDAKNRNYNLDHPAIVRTWIQDFTATWLKPHKRYGVQEVREQIKALNDLGYREYILWNASNRYSFEKEIQQ